MSEESSNKMRQRMAMYVCSINLLQNGTNAPFSGTVNLEERPHEASAGQLILRLLMKNKK
jgi:hypothetical protein